MGFLEFSELKSVRKDFRMFRAKKVSKMVSILVSAVGSELTAKLIRAA